jgi:hypothetical protein
MVPASPKVLRGMKFLPVTPGAISSIFLGCRASGVTKLAFRSALKAPHFKHVELLQGDLDRAEYSLNLRNFAREKSQIDKPSAPDKSRDDSQENGCNRGTDCADSSGGLAVRPRARQ